MPRGRKKKEDVKVEKPETKVVEKSAKKVSETPRKSVGVNALGEALYED